MGLTRRGFVHGSLMAGAAADAAGFQKLIGWIGPEAERIAYEPSGSRRGSGGRGAGRGRYWFAALFQRSSVY